MSRYRFLPTVVALSILGGCSQIAMPDFLQRGRDAGTVPLDTSAQPGSTDLSDDVRGVVTAPPPSANARTADDFDTTTAEQRAAATATTPGSDSGTRLGETVASLGDPAQSGLWIKSPLVKTAGPGRLENSGNGKTALVELIPLEGSPGGGSQVSLAALRLLEAPITDLTTLVVYTQ